jgi:DNA-binding NtrC family response regulator
VSNTRTASRDDVPALVPVLLERCCAEFKRAVPAVDAAVMAELSRRQFPGNVRELQSVLRKALIAIERIGDDSGRLTLTHLSKQRSAGSREQRRVRCDLSAETILEAIAANGSVARGAKALGISLSTMRRRIGELGIRA